VLERPAGQIIDIITCSGGAADPLEMLERYKGQNKTFDQGSRS
jgi:hypothetical protein